MKNQRFLLICLWILLLTTAVSAEQRFFEIQARKFSYSPHIVRVNRGDEVVIRLISADVTHGLYLDGYGIKTKAHPGQEGSISFVAIRTGRFTFRCSVTCGEFHPFMVGYLIVGPNIRFYLFVIIIGIIAAATLAAVFVKRRSKQSHGSGK